MSNGEKKQSSNREYEEIADIDNNVAHSRVIDSDEGDSREEELDFQSTHDALAEEVADIPVVPEPVVIVDDFGEELTANGEEEEIDFEQLSVEIDRRTRVEKIQAPAEEIPSSPVEKDIEDLKEKLPDDFSIENVASLNLREAEEIASEDVHLLAERGLDEELEELTQGSDDALASVKDESAVKSAPPHADVDYVVHVAPPPSPEVQEELVEEGEVDVREDEPAAEIPSEDDTGVPDAVFEQYDEAHESEDISVEEIDRYLASRDEDEHLAEEVREAPEGEMPGGATDEIIDEEETVREEVQSDETDRADAFIIEGIQDETPDALPGPFIEPAVSEVREEPVEKHDVSPIQSVEEDDISPIDIVEEDDVSPVERLEEDVKPRVQTQIPPDLLNVGDEESVYIIDDEMLEHEAADTGVVFEESDLERISSDIIGAVQSSAILLEEADVEEDQLRVAAMLRGAKPTFEDLLADTEDELPPVDDELDFINESLLESDYRAVSEVLAEEPESSEAISASSLGLLGLSDDEVESIEGDVFTREFKDIDLDAALRTVAAGLDSAPPDIVSKQYRYSLPKRESLNADEKMSIEADINASSAFVFEEDVENIREQLKRLDTERGDKVKEEIPDISNRVVIIEDRDDISRFLDAMPAEKRENMRKLLQYLDNLFEKLPEEVIERFSHSEYFDLYMKIFHDLGI